MAQGFPHCGKLSALYELEACFCAGVAGSDLGDILGGQVLQVKEEGPRVQDSSKRKRLVWCFALLGLLPLLVFKYLTIAH